MSTVIERTRAAVARLGSRRALIVAIGLGPIAGMLLGFAALAAQDAGNVITIDNFTFGPGELSVPVGTTVKWINRDDIPHSVVDSGKTFRSKALDTDDSFSFTFTTAGTFQYFCGLHPHMVGKVVVTP